jgi:tRNA G10  N-methylase Trm11
MAEPRKEVLADGVEIWLGDCRDILPTLGKVDAVVTDPPYGIGVDRAMAKQSGTQYGRAAAAKREYQSTGWDDAPPSRDLLDLVIGAGAHVVIWKIILCSPASGMSLIWGLRLNLKRVMERL